MDESITPSLLDLYKKASNPKKTNLERVHVQNTPFVDRSRDSSRRSSRRSSRHSSRRSDSQGSQRDDESSRRSDGSVKPRMPAPAPAFFTEGQRMFAERNQDKEKSVLLNEYNRLRVGGSNCPRNLTMNDDIGDIRWELNRVKCNDDCVSTVSVMKDMIKLGTTFVDMGNRKFQLLKLNGPAGNWSDECTKDMDRFDRCLTKLYQKYIRKGSVSPFIELALLLFGPMLAVHFRNSMGMGLPAAGPASNRPSRNVPFQQPTRQAMPQQRQAMPAPFSRPTRQAMPAPQFMPQQRQAMPGPVRQAMPPPRQAMPGPVRQAMPAPQFMQQQAMPQQRQAMPAPQFMLQQTMPQQQQTMPQQPPQEDVVPPVEIDILTQKRTGRAEPLEIVEENSEEESGSSDHHSIDIRDEEPLSGSDADSSSVGSFTY